MTEIQIFSPATMGTPRGQYSQITRVRASEFVFVAGQLSADREGNIIGAGDFERQCEQVFANVATALEAVGATWRNVVQFTTYLVHSQNIPDLMAFRTKHFPSFFPDSPYPPNTLLIVDRLVEEPFLVEVQAVLAL